jgi:hypothetical protein
MKMGANRKLVYLAFYFLLSLALLVAPTSCSNNKNEDTVTDCSSADDSLKDPKTMGEIVNLINALPKPVSLTCFLNALKPPLKVFAVNSTSSAQSAVGNASPRIFILKDKLSLSVVPAGIGKDLLELGELYASQSFKAEIRFPVEGYINMAGLNSYLSGGAGTSTCSGCHLHESKMSYQNTSGTFISDIFRPDESKRVGKAFMKIETDICKSDVNKFRCDMLKAIYVNGQATDDIFPY